MSVNLETIQPADRWRIDFKRRLHATALELPVAEGEEPVELIDIDLIQAPDVAQPYIGGLPEAVEIGKNLVENARRAARTKEQKLVAKGLASNVVMASALLAIHEGREVDFMRFSKGTVDITPSIVPDTLIHGAIKQLSSLLEDNNLLRGYSAASRKSILAKYGIANQRALRIYYNKRDEEADGIYGEIVKVAPAKPELALIKNKKPQSGQFTTDKDGIFKTELPANYQTRASLDALIAHENKGHANHYERMKKLVAEGSVSPVLGLTHMFTPEVSQAEVIAQVAELYLLENLPKTTFLHEVEKFKWLIKVMVFNNANIAVNSGAAEKDVLEKVKKLLPLEEDDYLEATVSSFRQDLVRKAYVNTLVPNLRLARRINARAAPVVGNVLMDYMNHPDDLGGMERTLQKYQLAYEKKDPTD